MKDGITNKPPVSGYQIETDLLSTTRITRGKHLSFQ